MNIFESLENLPVSEACFEDIISMVEAYRQIKAPSDSSNAQFTKLRQEYLESERNHNKVAKKLKKAIKSGRTEETKNLSKTLNNLRTKSIEAADRFYDFNSSQIRKSSKQPGIMYQDIEETPTGGYGRPVVKTSGLTKRQELVGRLNAL